MYLTHGMYQSRAYKIWGAMKSRCQNTNNAHYHEYGAKGIQVCEAWQTFEGFYADMGDPPEDLTLDRIDSRGGYNKENCRWVRGMGRTDRDHFCMSVPTA